MQFTKEREITKVCSVRDGRNIRRELESNQNNRLARFDLIPTLKCIKYFEWYILNMNTSYAISPLFNLSQRALTSASSCLTISLSTSHASRNVSPRCFRFSYSPECFHTSLRNADSSRSCRSMSRRLKLSGRSCSSLFSAWDSQGRNVSRAR